MNREYFVTDDTALAAYLYLMGMEFIEATLSNPRNPRRKKFVIYDEPNREQYVEDFYNRSTAVIPIEYHEARSRVMWFLKTTVEDPRN